MKQAMLRAVQIGVIALATGAIAGCGGSDGGGSSPSSNASGTIQGTAAVGAAMSNASITITCVSGNGAGTANANGQYSITFAFSGPCTIAAANGSTTLHSFASGSGTYNVTPLTELLLTYIAGQLGTDVNGLLGGLGSNATYQRALTTGSTIAAAESAVAQIVKTNYGVTLSSSAFLTTSFTPGQPGPDADLDNLRTAGALSSNGAPDPSLISTVSAAGAKAGNPTGGATGGTGGSGGSGSAT